jgi:hypothetical protein
MVPTSSFDHLVGAGEQRSRKLEPKLLGSLEIDDQFEFGGLLHGQIGGVGAFQNLVHVSGRTSIQFVAAIRLTGFMERRRVQSVRLDVGCADHLAPLLGFVGDEPAKISG